MLSFWALVYPGLRFPPADRPDVYVARRRHGGASSSRCGFS